jgi:sec-independent protein translocase protein TatA
MTGLTNPVHIALLLLVALLLFGAKRLPEIGRGLGSGMREFKDSITREEDMSPAADPVVATRHVTAPISRTVTGPPERDI